MSDVSVIFYFLKKTIVSKCQYIKSSHRVLMQNEVVTYGATVFDMIIVQLF
jgi:hypothetical protein